MNVMKLNLSEICDFRKLTIWNSVRIVYYATRSTTKSLKTQAIFRNFFLSVMTLTDYVWFTMNVQYAW